MTGLYWIYTSPYYSLYRAKVAYNNNDVGNVNKYVDLKGVISSITKATNDQNKDQSNPFAEGIIDMITPLIEDYIVNSMNKYLENPDLQKKSQIDS